MDLKKLVTIVIPCKNEKDIILKTLDLLNHQKDIHGVKVIVCDASNDGITKIDFLHTNHFLRLLLALILESFKNDNDNIFT